MDIPALPSSLPDTASFFALLNNRLKFRLFLLRKLPAACFSGLRVVEAIESCCRISVPYGWLTQNPFRSTYFASLSMAAELSTGALVMAHLYRRKPAASMLLVAMEGRFYKKATGITTFTCNEGLAIKAAVQKAYDTLQPQTFAVESVGCNGSGEPVALFRFTWSVKVRQGSISNTTPNV